MKFTLEYKQQCFNVFQYSGNYEKISSALENNDDLTFRFLIEDYLDDLERILKPRVLKEDEHLIWNSQVEQYNRAYKLYSEFMEEVISEIDVHSKLDVERVLSGRRE